MTNYGNDEEKLMNAAAQGLNNSLSAALNLASLGKPKLRVKVKSHTAEDDLLKARKALKNGVSIDKIKENLSSSPVVNSIKEKGKDASEYFRSILQNAIVKNEVERRGQTEQQPQINKEQGIER